MDKSELISLITEKGMQRALGKVANAPTTADASGASFSDLLKEHLGEVNRMQIDAEKAVQDFASGKNASIHETMITLNNADMSFRLMMQIRSKVLHAYREVMQMST